MLLAAQTLRRRVVELRPVSVVCNRTTALARRTTTTTTTGRRGIKTLILLRHGQSEWNSPIPTFTGWVDVSLTDTGRREAAEAGTLLARRGFEHVDVVFTSELQRAYETAEIVLGSIQEEFVSLRRPPIVRDVRFNERHYGAIQGICKNDQSLLNIYGDTQVREWRRSMHAAPPPMREDHPHYQPPPAPRTESLADCRDRCLEGFRKVLEPTLFERDDVHTALLCAHSNTLRALISHFDDVKDEDVPNLHIPNSVPIIYRFGAKAHDKLSRKLQSSAGGSHARWLLSTENFAKIHKALQPGGVLTRALFEAWDVDGSRALTAKEISDGLHSLDETDVAVAGIARQIARNITFNYSVVEDEDVCTLEQFEKTAKQITESVMRDHHVDDVPDGDDKKGDDNAPGLGGAGRGAPPPK